MLTHKVKGRRQHRILGLVTAAILSPLACACRAIYRQYLYSPANVDRKGASW